MYCLQTDLPLTDAVKSTLSWSGRNIWMRCPLGKVFHPTCPLCQGSSSWKADTPDLGNPGTGETWKKTIKKWVSFY